MPTNHDYWDESIHTLYTDVIEIFEADAEHNPLDVTKIIRLNNSGNELKMYATGYGDVTYMPAAFSFSEPDRNSINDETGTLTIAGVTNNYIEMINDADTEHLVVVRIGLVDYQRAIESISRHSADSDYSEDYWIYTMTDYVANNVSVSSANAQVQINFRSGAMQLQFYISKHRYGNTEFPCLFG